MFLDGGCHPSRKQGGGRAPHPFLFQVLCATSLKAFSCSGLLTGNATVPKGSREPHRMVLVTNCRVFRKEVQGQYRPHTSDLESSAPAGISHSPSEASSLSLLIGLTPSFVLCGMHRVSSPMCQLLVLLP